MTSPISCECCAEPTRLGRRGVFGRASMGLALLACGGAVAPMGAARAQSAGPAPRRLQAVAAPVDLAAEPIVSTPNPAARGMTELRPGLWRVQDGGIFATTLVTPEGAAVLDPINRGAADWLAAQIRERFQVPVRYVIYSHNHDDHIRGGEAFLADRPVFVAQRLAAASLARVGFPGPLPTLTFDDGFRITLGGRAIDLRYHGPNDGVGSISVHYPEAGVLSVVDWVVAKRLPWRTYARYDLDGTIASLQQVEQLAFDVVSPGHHVVGDIADVRILRRYLEALRDGVLAGMRARRTLLALVPELRATLAADPAFRTLAFFDDWVELNIAGAYDQMVRAAGWMPEAATWPAELRG